MTKNEAVVELLKPMMSHLAQEYRIATEPEKAAKMIARFVVCFQDEVGPALDPPE